MSVFSKSLPSHQFLVRCYITYTLEIESLNYLTVSQLYICLYLNLFCIIDYVALPFIREFGQNSGMLIQFNLQVLRIVSVFEGPLAHSLSYL